MHAGLELRDELIASMRPGAGLIEPFLGVYDCFSARIAGRYSRNLFLSGFGLAASFHGLPDVGYLAWPEMTQAAWRVRQILPRHRLLVDIDDGYVDIHTACHVARQLDGMGAAMAMLEDQARPRRCGHADGKRLLPLGDYIEKLEAVLASRERMCVLARTDASGEEMFRRVEAISATGADALLVDGVESLESLRRVRGATDKPLLFNQMGGGRSPRLSLSELREAGVNLVQYSTPLLFAAQAAMTGALDRLFAADGILPEASEEGVVGLAECAELLDGDPAGLPVGPAAWVDR